MKLSELIRKKEIATATPATFATVAPVIRPSVATVAGVAVAAVIVGKPETLQDRQREARRQKALALLDEQPETMRGIYPDTQSDRDNVILAVAIRGVGTCELAIPRAKYDPWLLLGMIERMSQTVH